MARSRAPRGRADARRRSNRRPSHRSNSTPGRRFPPAPRRPVCPAWPPAVRSPWAAARPTMRLEGIHHITAITGDAPRNVDFYTRVMGLRLVAKTVNQDDPSVYHLFYASETGRPGSELTFFEYPGASPGRAGDGMVHRIVSRVGTPEALDFWSGRLRDEGVES